MSQPHAPTNKTLTPSHRALLILLLLVGTALRLGAAGRVPPGLYHDEAQHGLDALAVLETGKLPLYFPANNGREPLFIYLVTAGVAVLGRSPLAIRLPAAFAGVLTLAATYDLARVLWDRRTGRWALGVLAVTFWHVHLSRVGFRAVLLPLFTALTLGQAARALKSGRTRHWIAAGACYGLAWYSYMAARFTPVALAAVIIYGLLAHRQATTRAWRGALIFCAAALIVLAPLGLYTLRHPDVVLARTGQVSVFSAEINHGDPWGTLARHTLRTLGMVFVQGDRIWRHNLAWRPVWGPALALAFAVGLGVALARWRDDAGAALALLWTGIMALPTLLAEDAPHFLRAAGVLPTLALVPALGLRWLEARFSARRWLRLLPAGLLLLAGAHTAYDYFVRYAHAPLAYHWFEAGPVALASDLNALRGQGWTGQSMLHGPDNGRALYVHRDLWQSWTAVPFLVPEERLRFLPPDAPLAPGTSATFAVWPYGDWAGDVFPYLAHPAYLRIAEGPQAQGDKDPAPTTIALYLHAEPRPPVPDPVAHFAPALVLRAALVAPGPDGADVRLWWDPQAPLNTDLTVFVHYLREGVPLDQHDAQPGQGRLPTTRWQPGDLILDEHPLSVLNPDPARDTLRVGLYESATVRGVPLVDAAGEPLGDWVELPVILVEP